LNLVLASESAILFFKTLGFNCSPNSFMMRRGWSGQRAVQNSSLVFGISGSGEVGYAIQASSLVRRSGDLAGGLVFGCLPTGD
jgi:hypothetical protein